MKKYIVFLFIFFTTIYITGCSLIKKELSDIEIIKNRGYIIVGVKSDSPPFGFYKDKKLTGIDIEIAKSIAANIFHSDSDAFIKFVQVSALNRISKLNSKEVDILVATMSINEKRKLIMDFSMPYFAANQKMMVRKNSKILNLTYFNKQGRLAVVMGTTGEKIIRLIAPNANLVGVKTYVEAINLLRNNQVEGVVGDDCILASFVDDGLKILDKIYSKEFYCVAVRKSENSKDLLNVINASIAAFLDEKKLNPLLSKWTIY